ncbi:MAG TPA: fructosamine kinase family protein [Steroidobacteraceae bacterium]|nr:fructosamine kinase family protein [Steroidobacteraceae bacterium]
MESFAAIAREIAALTGSACEPAPRGSVGGGSINRCYRWNSVDGPLFVKVAPPGMAADFEAEAAGLAELERAHALRVPRVRACGGTEDAAFLALEWLARAAPSAVSERRLGEGLAALHQVTAPRFGWSRDNTIGRTPQSNSWTDDWAEFFAERRLRPQLLLAVQNGFGELLAARGERLIEALPRLLAGHRPAASLLHGDLWGGNWLATPEGEPVVFDPAVYCGDRETDLAMTRLFGGFGSAFYVAYEHAAPLTRGAAHRVELYNLYHVLNHANLFGGGYARQARASIDRLLAEAGG